MIRFNKPYITGNEVDHINKIMNDGRLSGNGSYTKMCQAFFEERYGFNKTLLTTSCTDALEMCAILLDLQSGDEVIVPSFTFVSTANAFRLLGAEIRFADSSMDTPNMTIAEIEPLITDKTRAIVIVHYAGVACDMDPIMELAKEHELIVIEDAAQAINSYYKDKPLGSIGHLAAFSFHETKNLHCGEGGLLVINDEQFEKRAEIIWEKGTNRAAFFRGEVDKYNWVDLGSSFLPSELNAAFLWAQLEQLDDIQKMRTSIWNTYYKTLQGSDLKDNVEIIPIPEFATNNGHMFYFLCKNGETRNELLKYLNELKIQAVFHYLPLHDSPYYEQFYKGGTIERVIDYSERLIRLPFYNELEQGEIESICSAVVDFFQKH